MIFQAILWVSALALIHTYFIYPLILKIISSNKKGNQIVFAINSDLPTVSIIIPAYNEQAVI